MSPNPPNNKDDKPYGEIRHEVKLDYMKKNYIKDKEGISWLEKKEDVPEWLSQLFYSKDYKDRMDALRELNTKSMLTRVENN